MSLPAPAYHTPDQIPAELRPALESLLALVADNKLALGRHYATWSVSSPILESSVALAAMAQDELGHARSFYPVLRTFAGRHAEAEAEERGWPPGPHHPLPFLDRPLENWVELVVANFLPDTMLTALCESAAESRFEPLRQRAAKIVPEEATHWIHAETWVHRLAADGRTSGHLSATLRAVWPQVLAWFGPKDDRTARLLAETGILSTERGGALGRFLARVGPVLERHGLLASLPAREHLDWSTWDPKTRRLRAEGG